MMDLRIGDFVDVIEPCRPVEVPMPAFWNVLRIHTNREAKVMRTFQQRGISAYLPLERKCEVFRGRKMDVTLPLFPGLIFIPDFERPGSVLGVDGVIEYLQFGPWTAEVSPELMDEIRTIEAVGRIPLSVRKRLFKVGEQVKVVDGPFASFPGLFEGLDSDGRLSVIVDIFQRMVPVTFDADQIEPADASTDAKDGTAGAKHRRKRAS